MSSQLKTAITINDSAIVDGNTIDAADHTTPFGQAEAQFREGQASVSSADTHVKHLEDAILGTAGKVKVTKQDTGADESLALDLDATGVTSGYVPTANGSGGWGWGAVGGGGAQPIDITGTAGEDLDLRDYVYLDESSGTWFKVDTDATPVKCGRIRGVVNDAAILSAASGSIRLIGEVSGFTGLTAWQPVYASTTPGGITQTRPSPVSGGAQVAIVEIGFAVSTTNIVIMPQQLVQYMKRDNALANDATLTLQHHADEMGHKRRASAYIGSSEAGSTSENYGSANQDVDVGLRWNDSTVDTVDVNDTGAPGNIGKNSFSEKQDGGQSFQVDTTSILAELRFTLSSNNGSPTGDLTWSVRADNAGEPGSILTTGGFTPTPSAENTVILTLGQQIELTASTLYWLVLEADDWASFADTTGYRWERSSSGTYADGSAGFFADGVWSDLAAFDHNFYVRTVEDPKDKLAQTFTLASETTLHALDLYLKKIGSPTGTLTVRIETLSGGDPTGTLVDANATGTVLESSLGTSYADVTINFADSFTLSAGTYAIVLSTDRTASASNYVAWGADGSSPGYAGGEMLSEESSVWASESKDAIFALKIPGTTFVETAIIGRWSGADGDVTVRYDDGAGSDASTKTTFKNIIGASADVTAVIEVA
ncbi:hypothetical protein C8B47_03730 [filamentous cyanobacterium CCP4]|nr:hypothetical protein C8B47_03730 [filamentous cyanobacterium CCP4]